MRCSNEPRSASATAEEPTVTRFIPRADLLGILENSPRLAVNLVREFSLRLRDFNRQYIREVLEAERLALVGRFARSIVHDFKNPLIFFPDLLFGDKNMRVVLAEFPHAQKPV